MLGYFSLKFFMVKFFFGLFLATSCFLTACNNSAVDLTLTQDTIMVINACADATEINFIFNNEIVNPSPLAYTKNTNYSLIDAGTKQVVCTQPPSTTQLLSIPMLFKPRKTYSVFLAGQISTNQLIFVATEDDLNEPKKNRAKYRFINLSPNSVTLDFKLVKTKDSVLIANLPYGSASTFSQIQPGKYNFKIASRDTTIKDSVTLNYTLTNGKIYTFWAKGLVKSTGNKALGIKTIENK